jgi:uncharacterized protein YcbK (DUF882 family)
MFTMSGVTHGPRRPKETFGFGLVLVRNFSFLRSSRLIKAAALAAVATICGADLLQDAVANGDTRTLSFHHVHSGESATITFKRNGRYDPAALQQLNVLLQDWRRKEPTKMDPALFDIVWEVYRDVDATAPIEVIGGYRSPATNAMLRARSRGVAQMSQHMLGKAMDFYIPGVPLAKIREAGLRLQRGGVGFYPTSGSPFVHLDTGGIRHWPRMTRDQLVRVFPDGKTVHIPADGKPMPGYAAALAQVESRGSRPGGAGAAFASAAPSGSKKNIFAALFSKDSGDDDEENAAPQAGAAQTASADDEAPANAKAAPAAAPAQVAAAQPVPAVNAAASVVASANVPLPVRNPMGRSPEAVAALTAAAPASSMQAAAVPRPMMRPGEAPARPAAPPTLAAAADGSAMPLPASRPGVAPARAAAAPMVVASADPAAVAPVAQIPAAQAPVARAAPAQSQAGGGFPALIVHGTESATGGPTLSYASAGEFVVARPAPGRANEPAALPPGMRGTSAPPPQPHSAATQAEIRRLFSSPTVASDTTLRTPELRRFGAFVAPPRQVVEARFSRDASSGLATTRFEGAAVVAIPVVASAAHVRSAPVHSTPVESAPVLPKRAKKLSMAGTGTTDNLPPPH